MRSEFHLYSVQYYFALVVSLNPMTTSCLHQCPRYYHALIPELYCPLEVGLRELTPVQFQLRTCLQRKIGQRYMHSKLMALNRKAKQAKP